MQTPYTELRRFVAVMQCFTFSANWMESIEVSVCEKGISCQFCGKPDPVPQSSWSFLNCQGGFIKGNQIQLYNSNDPLQFCEINIIGHRKPKTHF